MLASKLIKLLGITSAAILSSTFCTAPNAQQYPFAEVVQYRANNPIEDRFCLTQLKSIKGFTASVFDGHGGDIVSQYASQHLNKCIEDRLTKNKNAGLSIEANVQKSVIQAYKDVEDSFFAIFKQNLANKAYRTVGSCALTAVVLKDKLIIANAGDCQGVLLSNNEAAMTNLRLNAGQPFEQARLVRQFPGEPDIFVCKGACYLKNRLQPTRSFGDYYLKYKQYNFTNIKNFTGPYLTSVPLITSFALNNQHQNLILATDGLWDQMDARQIYRIYKKNRSKLGESIFSRAIELILQRNNLKSKSSLDKIENRRNLHDDITIINLDLQQLRKLL